MDIAATRKALGLSQAELAKTFGVTQGTVSRWENKAVPDVRVVLALEALAMRQADKAA